MPTQALLPIPQNLAPGNFSCYQFQLPLDPEWLAQFFGALDQLTRWNSYQRDASHHASAIAQQWKEIIANARADVCGDPCPGFYLDINDVNCPNVADLRTSRVVRDCGNCTSRERVYFSRSILDVIAGVARIGYSAFDFATDLACGGHFCQVRAYQTGIGTPHWVLQWSDCLNTLHETTLDGVDEFVYNDFDARWMCLSLNSNFCATVSVSGPVLCTVS